MTNWHQISFDFSPKRWLLRLNRDLDQVLDCIDAQSLSSAIYQQSHITGFTELTKVQAAILFLEDRQFFSHSGVELRASFSLIKRLIVGGRLGAISTIDQQLVRIATGRYERTIRRKIRELLLAVLLNAHRSKASIFYAYMHKSYFGYKLEGVEINAKFIFCKYASRLSWDEASFVASLLARPFPKQIYEIISRNDSDYNFTPEEIILLAETHAPNWGIAISRRYQYVRDSLRDTPSSLKIR
ncbi:biosynthetic peptidoglycan transglycosylase [Loktanella sp. DJP18]|uniref:biosynthetic peptidoglycan transglycosylase n=1 Tax=Loktanella sp. DJP18 TaxID=3409788 RepID=UPI003BB6D900